jgi:hypothetical protein
MTKSQVKYAIAETVKHIANHYNLTSAEVMAKIEEGKNRIADEFDAIMLLTMKAI